MFWSLILLGLCATRALWNVRAALIFAIPLMMAMAVTYFQFNHAHVWFFAIYTCISSLAFFLVDWKAGALVGIVAIVSALHVFGAIDTLHRDIAGETLFALGLLASILSKPTRGAASIVFGAAGLPRYRSGIVRALGMDSHS